MNNPKLGNRVILLVVAITLAVASLFVQWGVIRVTAGDLQSNMTFNGQNVPSGDMENLFGGMMSSMLSGMGISVNGLNGSLFLGPLKIPFWIAIAAVVCGNLITISNNLRFSDVPRSVVISLLSAGLGAGVWGLIAFLTNGTIGLGALLLIAAAIIGLTQQKGVVRQSDRSVLEEPRP
ncbi:MAG: hypothetical protein U0795_14950 [Pirellulales bacterium]